ncbi:4-hydroxy-tetrahydrodipicolinate synthase [Poriferisphaera corsica]|uniref:4-hydroxy-tetrahydrodipicolinate synthase n=1 Tax=Poriferisphaera corsica TaxID=2528020 RepID=A0A517YQR1_9BACT|nr:4-hydroxy-tetrahydrodipicolinate synthase [Poriferisphaera corsica]QDU32548.1 4-hydroxy-tetrahydrodipicolinate synthase [Poriferisphaera corsica]
MQLQGAYTAMITPFRAGEVDFDRLRANVDDQIDQGIDGLVPVGTTGECPTLSHEEHRDVIKTVVEQANGRVKIIAGTGSNSTTEALNLTKHAKDVGADAALIVNPYYNKPNQQGLYRHFMHLADNVDIPIILYNIPGRTGITMEAPTVARLAKHTNIVAIKEATGSCDMTSEIRQLTDLTIVSGDDSLTLPLMSIGASGVISVLSNIIPAKIKSLTAAALNGDFAEALQHHNDIFPLCKACLTLATNPITIKTAMAICGRDTGELRLPLCEMPTASRAILEDLLREHNIR